tara:strand:+ start:244 stop:447 length:204 start_codon:yes stop_codon:yes gene_type:complete
MVKFILLGIGFLLVFEGLMYFFLAKNLLGIFEKLQKINPELIRNTSLIFVVIGFCLIYFTFRFYGEY